MLSPDDALVSAARAGDSDAITELLRRHGPAVEAALRVDPVWRALIEPADVMQITYLEAFLQMERYDPQRGVGFRAWLARLAENNLRDAIRGLQAAKRPSPLRQARPRSEDSVQGLLAELAAESATPSRSVARRELHGLLDAALGCLPQNYGEVIRLYDLEQRPIEEVAARLGRSPAAVHMLRARAHDRLREQLGLDAERPP